MPIYNRLTRQDLPCFADMNDGEREELQKYIGNDPRSTKEAQKYDTAIFSIKCGKPVHSFVVLYRKV